MYHQIITVQWKIYRIYASRNDISSWFCEFVLFNNFPTFIEICIGMIEKGRVFTNHQTCLLIVPLKSFDCCLAQVSPGILDAQLKGFNKKKRKNEINKVVINRRPPQTLGCRRPENIALVQRLQHHWLIFITMLLSACPGIIVTREKLSLIERVPVWSW